MVMDAGTDPRNMSAPWDGLLASAGPRDHIVQLYQDQAFLNRAVCRFAAGAIETGRESSSCRRPNTGRHFVRV